MADQLDAEAVELGKAGEVEAGLLKMLEAQNLRAMSIKARASGLVEMTSDLLRATTRRRALQNAKQSGKVGGMTSVQAADRAQAISKAKAGKDEFLKAVSKSKWRSMNRYARQRLKKSPGMLTAYRQGTYPVPQDIQAKIFEDFGMRIGRSE